MSKRLKSYLRFWVRLFWTTVFFAVIAIAVLLQIGRTFFPVINEYRLNVETQLSLQLGVNLSIGEIEAAWKGLRPRVSLNDVSILNELGEPVFEIGQIDVELSLIQTLYKRNISFRRLAFRNLEASIEQAESGSWNVHGLPESTSMSSKSTSEEFTIDDPLDIFLFGRRVELVDTSLEFIFNDGLQASVVIPKIRLENDSKFHRLSASFAVDGSEQELNFLLEGLGDPRDESDFEASGFIELNDFPIEKVLAAVGLEQDILLPRDNTKHPKHWQDDGRVNLNLWFGRTAEKGITWQGDIHLDGVPFLPREGMIWPNTIGTQFVGDWQAQKGWQMSLANLNLHWKDFSAPAVNLNVYGGVDQPVKLAIESVNVKDWYQVISKGGFLTGHFKTVFDDLQPEGQLQNIWVDVLSKKQGYFFLTADVKNGSVHPWEGVPAIEQVNGYLETTAFDGHVSLDSVDGFSMGFPKIYLHSLNFKEAHGDVRWSVDLEQNKIGISSGLIRLRSNEIAATGYINLALPIQHAIGVEPEMTLMIGVEKGVASLHKMLVPYTVPKKLNEWLDRSIKDGVLTDAEFIYHGSLLEENQLSRVIQFSSSVHQAILKFDPKWPELTDASGVMLLDDADFRAANLRGNMMGTKITDGEVALLRLPIEPDDEKGVSKYEQAVSIKAKVLGDSGRAIELIKKTPIAHILGEELTSWKMQGAVEGSIALVVPLDDNSSAAEQNIELTLIDNELEIPSLKLTVNNISGPLNYSHDAGVNSPLLTAKFWDQFFDTKISTRYQGLDSSVNVEFSGSMDVQRLQNWSQRPELRFAQGITPILAKLSVPIVQTQSPISLTATSSLAGIYIDLPPPFKKSAEKKLPLSFALDVFPLTPQSASSKVGKNPSGIQRYWFSIDGISEALVVTDNDKVQGVSIVLDGESKDVDPGFLSVQGALREADIVQWSDVVVQYQEYVNQQEQLLKLEGHNNEAHEGDSLPLKMDLQVADLKIDSLLFDDVAIIGSQTQEAYNFAFTSLNLAGNCSIYDDGRPLKVDLQHMHLNLVDQSVVLENATLVDQEPVDDVSGLMNVDVTTLPAMDFSVLEFKSGVRNYGQWSYKLRPINGGVIAYDLHAKVLGLTVQGKNANGAELIWLQSHEKNETFFSGLVTAGDIGPVMEKWDMEKALSSDYASFITDVQWSGAPDEIALESLFGIIDVDLNHGHFIRGASAGGNPLVKLVGLLNFDTLARRFRFDFSDLNSEGMSYDSVKGSFLFKRGVVLTNHPLIVKTPASDIQFDGDIYVLTEKVDAQLVVTLPIAGLSTTIAAALTGGVPLAVGVFVAGKIFKDQVDQASSMRYHVIGSWDDPEMELEKVFENKMEQ